MNYKKAVETIENILEDSNGEKVCILIDGQWGIGKTYTINRFIENSKESISFKYVSLFGKEDLKDIEKDIVLQMLPIQKIKSKLDNNNGLKIFGNIAGDILKQYTGLDSNFIRNISIENIKSDDNVIICIDDLERKSENIKLKDILGLIERASSNFNIILIGSLSNLKEEEIKDFNNFKEKIIDYELIVNELRDETLIQIVRDKFGEIQEKLEAEIVLTFKKNKLEDKQSLNNLRIYIKYVNLLYRVNLEMCKILDTVDDKLDEKIIDLCNRVVYENYINVNKDNKKNKCVMDYRSDQLKNTIDKIFKYEEYDENILKDYCEIYSQVQSDIKSLYNLYKLSREEASEISDRILQNIELENKEYFIKQKYIIELYDILYEIGIIDSFKDGLIEIAENLYEPDINVKPEQFDINDYNIYDPIEGERQNYNVYFIINHINKYNMKSYNSLRDSILTTNINNKDIDGIKEIIKYYNNIDFVQFRSIYDIAINILYHGYNETVWEVICNIIDKTDSMLVESFLKQEQKSKKEKNENSIISNVRLKRLIDILNEKKYFEWQMESQKQMYEEEMEGN